MAAHAARPLTEHQKVAFAWDARNFSIVAAIPAHDRIIPFTSASRTLVGAACRRRERAGA
jgi:hypothetical protein